MINLKNIADLPVAESVDNLNLIVNENGSAKQIASSAVGAQADWAETNENSPAFIKNKPGYAQADWAETDESNASYVRNKTHYVERNVVIDILPETTYTLMDMGDEWGTELPPDINFIANKTYQIHYNGTSYECIAMDLPMAEPGAVYLGNPAMLGGPDNGMPFAMVMLPGMRGQLASPSDSEVTLSISYIGDRYHTLDPNYIKDMYYSTQFNNVEILAETTQIPDEDGYICLQEPMELLVENGMYTVNWNGVEYLCQCLKDGEELILESEPFNIGYHPDMSMEGLSAMINVLDGSTSVTLSIVGSYEEVKKIDMKYIPYEVQDSINEIHNIVDDVRNVANKMDKTNPVGTGSFSMNRKSGTTIGDYSHAEGQETTASGKWSHAEGGYTTASGNCSHAEGGSTSASGDNSHAEGYSTEAYGLRSHAEGEQTFALGDYSHVEGSHTTANRAYQHVQGKYNIAETGDAKQQGLYAHIVGNGTPSQRSNAHTLDWEGNAWFAGYVEGNAVILPSSTEGSTKRFRITVDDSGVLTATEVL